MDYLYCYSCVLCVVCDVIRFLNFVKRNIRCNGLHSKMKWWANFMVIFNHTFIVLPFVSNFTGGNVLHLDGICVKENSKNIYNAFLNFGFTILTLVKDITSGVFLVSFVVSREIQWDCFDINSM